VYSMAYDALGRCMKRTLTGGPTTYYVYDGDKPILEYDSSGASVGVNVYGKGVAEPSEWRHREMDGQAREGNGRAERERTSQYAATYRSTYTTAAFNFYEYRARAYNAKFGRFMSEDPKLFDAGDYNLFRYCHNDPVDNVDPLGLEENLAQKPISAWDPTGRAFEVDLTISERISLWQKSMETSIGGEQATLTLQSVQIRDALSRQLGQGSFRDQHIEFRPTGKTTTSLAGNPITRGKVIYYVNGEPVAVYPANSGGFKSKNSLVIGNDTRTPAGHYLGTNFHKRYDNAGMVREGVGFSLNLNPLFYTNRTLLRMHPDGGNP